jgi:Family of unknown function (DUF5681)
MSFGSGNKHGWKPGQSGNPGGRPKAIVEVAAAAREHTLAAIKILFEIASNVKATDSARVSAAVALLERGWGKAPATVTLRHLHDLKGLSDDELAAIALGTDAQTGGSSDAPPKTGSSDSVH